MLCDKNRYTSINPKCHKVIHNLKWKGHISSIVPTSIDLNVQISLIHNVSLIEGQAHEVIAILL